MKVLRILICMVFIFASIADAKVYILVDKDTREIKSLSSIDDAQLESGWEKVVLDIDIKDIELIEAPKYYKYKNDRFVINAKKISDEELAKAEKLEAQAEFEEIMNRMKKNAQKELEAEGKKFKHKHCNK